MKTQNQNYRIYLAGPEVFLPNAAEIGERKKALCRKYGFEGVFPLDAPLDVDTLSLYQTGLLISANNENLINSCKYVIANITPFRGASADAGTVYEIGFARGKGLTVLAYTNVSDTFTVRTCDCVGIKRSAAGETRDNNGMLIEDYGMSDNLMIEGGIKASGGRVVVNRVPENELFTNLEGFEECLIAAARIADLI